MEYKSLGSSHTGHDPIKSPRQEDILPIKLMTLLAQLGFEPKILTVKMLRLDHSTIELRWFKLH